jgi:hypothetical protein
LAGPCGHAEIKNWHYSTFGININQATPLTFQRATSGR